MKFKKECGETTAMEVGYNYSDLQVEGRPVIAVFGSVLDMLL